MSNPLDCTAKVVWRGKTGFVRDIIARTEPAVLHREVFVPFLGFVIGTRIPLMYLHKGRVSGGDGQMAWPALSKWTLAGKVSGQFRRTQRSTNDPMTSGRMQLAKSYVINILQAGPTSFRFKITNFARATSRWSHAFDYASALHRGWGSYTVRPRPGNKHGLAIPIMRASIGASEGRASGGSALAGFGYEKGRWTTHQTKSGKTRRKWSSATSGNEAVRPGEQLETRRAKITFGTLDPRRVMRSSRKTGDWIRAFETHPQGAPPRPHIKFFGIDARWLGKSAIEFCLRGTKPSPSRAVL